MGRIVKESTRIGFLFDEEYSDKLVELSCYEEVTPYELLCHAIDTLHSLAFEE